MAAITAAVLNYIIYRYLQESVSKQNVAAVGGQDLLKGKEGPSSHGKGNVNEGIGAPVKNRKKGMVDGKKVPFVAPIHVKYMRQRPSICKIILLRGLIGGVVMYYKVKLRTRICVGQ